MNIKSFYFFALFLLGCNIKPTPTPVKVMDDCDIFLAFIRKNWAHADSNVYDIKSDTLDAREIRLYFRKMAKPCLVGMSRAEIHALFGKPSREYDASEQYGRIDYYLKDECNHPVSGCVKLKIGINPGRDSVIKVFPVTVEYLRY